MRTNLSSSGRETIEAGLEIAFAAQANQLLCHLSLFEKEQSRNRTDPVLSGQFLEFIDVHLADSDSAIVLLGQFVKNRGERLTRATPLGPKIHQDGIGRLQNFGQEVRLGE